LYRVSSQDYRRLRAALMGISQGSSESDRRRWLALAKATLEAESEPAAKRFRARSTEGKQAIPRWRVDLLGERLEHLGTIEAVSAKEARLKALRAFAIPSERGNRVAVEKVNKDKA
jgi:hypothetical protein